MEPIPRSADEELEEPDPFAQRRRRRMLAAALAAALVVTAGIGWATDGFTRAPAGLLRALEPPCPPVVSLNGTGSTLAEPLMTVWDHAYSGGAASRNRGCIVVQVAYNASGAIDGLGLLGAQETDFVTTEQPLTPALSAGLAGPTITLPIALSGVAIAYHLPGVAAGLKLNGTLLAEIYLGTVTAWDSAGIQSLNPGVTLPSNLSITVIHHGPGSSTSFVFTQYLAAENDTWAADVGVGSSVAWPTGTTVAGDPGAAALLDVTPGAIAYLGFPTALAANVTCAQVENPAGFFVAPSPTSVFLAASAYGHPLPLGNESWQGVSLVDLPGNGSYPLTTFTYAIAYADLGTSYGGALPQNSADWLASFLYFMSVAGQTYGPSAGYGQLPASTLSANEQIVELLKFYGTPVLYDVDYDGD